jgi:hypothetical protein
MLETLRAWLNGTKEYYTGVAIYATLGSNSTLLSLFRKGKSLYNSKRLEEELLVICNNLKSRLTNNHAAVPYIIVPAVKAKVQAQESQSVTPVSNFNEELYTACKREADLVYKEAMNLRAELFALGRAQGYEDINRPDLVQQRSKMAVEVVVLYNKASKLYERANYVKEHGRLPNEIENDEEETEYDNLPDHLVKKTLDNLRKNYNKIKHREQTPERIELLQKHEKNIKKLMTKWDLLNIKK